ncbi:MAG TPA: hypothetical protein VIJ27_03790, partial [Mucilaginibacter sp.]
NRKYWQVLLTKWRKQGNDGLTIPFIIGSQKYLPGSGIRQTIDDLIVDIAVSTEFEVYLNYCLTINDLILAVRDDKKLRIPVKNVVYNNNTSSFFISTFLDDMNNDITSVTAVLCDKYQQYVDTGNYSINDNERGYFTSDEIAFIKLCFHEL